jgi:hypothetical protein
LRGDKEEKVGPIEKAAAVTKSNDLIETVNTALQTVEQ